MRSRSSGCRSLQGIAFVDNNLGPEIVSSPSSVVDLLLSFTRKVFVLLTIVIYFSGVRADCQDYCSDLQCHGDECLSRAGHG